MPATANTEEANVPDKDGLPTFEELQRPVREWLQQRGGDGHPKCSVCGERWAASVTEDSVAIQAVPHRKNIFRLSVWKGANLGPERRATTLRELFQGLYRSSTPVVRITCHLCGNMVFFDAYKMGVLERPR